MRNIAFVTCLLLLLAVPGPAVARGHLIGNLPGLQFSTNDATYNLDRDEFFVTYSGVGEDDRENANVGGSAVCGARIGPDGEVRQRVFVAGPETGFSYNFSQIEYNLSRGGYLAVLTRNVSNDPNSLEYPEVRYLDGGGALRAGPVRLDERGVSPEIAYNPVSDRFMAMWDWGYQATSYRMLYGPATTTPFIGNTVRLGERSDNGDAHRFIGVAAHNWRENMFLYAYMTNGTSGGNEGDVIARILGADGNTVRADIGIGTSSRYEGGPQVAYALSTNEWMVAYVKHNGNPTGFDIEAAFVNVAGAITRRITIEASPDWDALGNAVYDPSTDRIYVTYRARDRIWMKAVNPHSYATERIIQNDEILAPAVHTNGASPQAIAVRPDASNPQVLVVWIDGYGLDGVEGTLISLRGGTQTPIRGGGSDCEDAVPGTGDDFPEADVTVEPIEPSGSGVGPLTCTPANLDVARGDEAVFRAGGGEGEYRWIVRSSAGDASFDGGTLTFATDRIGVYRVGLTDRNYTATSCLLTVGTSFTLGTQPSDGEDDGGTGTNTTEQSNGDTDDTDGMAGDEGIFGAAQVMTGPFGAVVGALALAAVAGGLYLSYTQSRRYRTREVDELRRLRDPLDFQN